MGAQQSWINNARDLKCNLMLTWEFSAQVKLFAESVPLRVLSVAFSTVLAPLDTTRLMACASVKFASVFKPKPCTQSQPLWQSMWKHQKVQGAKAN